jgi:hypothetical protein
MHALRNFEIDAIRLLANSTLDKSQLDCLASFTGSVEYEYTGSGYYLTVRMPMLPDIRSTLAHPFVMGEADGIGCGFVVFLEPGALTLECHTWGAVDVPNDFRERNVVLSMPNMNYVIDVTGN